MPKIFKILFFLLVSILAGSLHAVLELKDIRWGTHQANSTFLNGGDYATSDGNFSTAKSAALLKSLTAAGAVDANLVDGTDLIELGFFDRDNTDDSSYDPNSDSSNLFKGVWTPLSSVTKIGQDYDSGGDVTGGEFYFASRFANDNANEASEANDALRVTHNPDASIYLGTSDSWDILDGNLNPTSFSQDNDVDDIVNAIYTESVTNSNPVMLGIRFYDTGGKTTGTTKYNTIMNPNWTMDLSNTDLVRLDLLEGYNDGSYKVRLNQGLVFEFDNSDANSANLAKVGSSDTQISDNDFVTTITYHDGSSALDASSASHILSGFDGSGLVTVGGDHTFTINANGGVDRSFSGDIEGSGNTSGASNLVKTGSGKQVLAGDIRLAGTSSGWLNIDNGTLSLSGSASGKVHTFEYLTGDPGTAGALELNNTNLATVEFGFANTSTSQTFDGNLSLVGSGAENIIKIASGTSGADYSKEQNISGVVTGSNELVKEGVGRLVLKANNANTGGVEIKNGTLVVGNDSNNADLGTGTINITKGKLEVLAGDSISNTIQGADASNKSMVGGDGTISSVTIGGDTAEITVVSPGQGISSSISSETTTQQSSVGTGGSADLAMGDFTVTTLALNDGGVYDWEITDFSESGVGGTDYDVLKFNSLTFDNTGTFTINILSLQADGTAGAVGGSDGYHFAGMQNLWDDSWNNATNKAGSYKGFKFLDGASHANITWGGVTSGGSAPTSSGGYIDNYFSIDQRGFSYHNDFWMGDWNVWYDGSGDFYLQFSAVPEPSTYMMVTGLLMLPGMSYVRRLRNKNIGEGQAKTNSHSNLPS